MTNISEKRATGSTDDTMNEVTAEKLGEMSGDGEQPEVYMPTGKTALKQSVVLVGLMGAGKTTVGRRLAAALGTGFVDSDEEVEKAADMTIAEIFKELGEPAFREGERRVIARLLDGPPQIVATGGGAFMNDQTRALIAECGVSVWLRAELDTLVERTSRRNSRPLLSNGNARDILAGLMAERHPIYGEANIIVDSGPDDRHEDVAARIIDGLQKAGALD